MTKKYYKNYKKPEVQENLELTAMIANQFTNKFFGPQPPEAYDKPINIVVAGNGIFKVRKTEVAIFKEKIAPIKNKDLNMLPAMEEGPELLIPKLKYEWLIKILSFYRDVNEKDGTEASVLLFWNHQNIPLPTQFTDGNPIKGLSEDGQLVIYCPIQKNSGSLSDFTKDPLVDYLRENFSLLLETHSH